MTDAQSNETMTHEQKLQWMAMWCVKNHVALELEGECGVWRECVGILTGGSYPDYEWYDPQTYERIDSNGKVWAPADAYHKHTCVAVLGRGEPAEAQLYDWLKWFDTNGFVVETGAQELRDPRSAFIEMALGRHVYKRMVRKPIEVLPALEKTHAP